MFALSVPFTPRSSTPPDPAFSAIPRDTFFYIRYFQEIGRPEHELDRDLKRSLKTRYWAGSGNAPAGQWLAPKPGDAGILDGQTPPAGDLMWLPDSELRAQSFEAAGFGPPLNWFRNLTRNWQETAQYAGATVRQSAGFMVGEKDAALSLMRKAVDRLADTVPDLRIKLILPGVGHWAQQEAPEAVNAALLGFFDGVKIDRNTHSGPVPSTY